MVQNSDAEIARLIALGYDRRDLQILDDGQVTIVQHDEMRGSALAIEKATAADRLKKMMERKLELDYMASAMAVAGQSIPVEIEEEFLKLKSGIETAIRLVEE